MSLGTETRPLDNPSWVGDDGWYQPHDFWLSLCGLYDLYRFSLDRLGDLRGKRVLDCGCGHGQTSIMLAKRGAQVIAFDVSAEDLSTARRLAERNGVQIDFRRMPFETLDLENGSVDLAFGACVLHHVNIPEACRQLGRVLRPGARALFVENSARNAVLMFARQFIVGSFGVPRYSDDHERPLTRSDLEHIAAAFPGRLAVHHPDFLFLRLIDFYVLQKRWPLLTALLERADRLASKIPFVNRYGYFQVIELVRS